MCTVLLQFIDFSLLIITDADPLVVLPCAQVSYLISPLFSLIFDSATMLYSMWP